VRSEALILKVGGIRNALRLYAPARNYLALVAYVREMNFDTRGSEQMSIFDKMKQGASEAARLAQQTVETTKLRSKISTREKEMDRISTRIGKAVFEAYLEGDLSHSEEQVLAYCEELSELRDEITELESRIKHLKEEKTCVCGKVVGPDVNYCPDCGKRLIQPQEVKPDNTIGEIRVICYHCKTENDILSKYCIQCGEELSSHG